MKLRQKDNKWFVRSPVLVEEVRVVVLEGRHQKPSFKILTHDGQVFHSVDNPQFYERLFDDEEKALEYAYFLAEKKAKDVEEQIEKLSKQLQELKAVPELGVEIWSWTDREVYQLEEKLKQLKK